jgi:hypothetical protein
MYSGILTCDVSVTFALVAVIISKYTPEKEKLLKKK